MSRPRDAALTALPLPTLHLLLHISYWLQLAAGYHYCKLLSPSRAIEWMYVDGLRWHDSLTSGTNDEVWMPQWGPSDAEVAEGSEAAVAAAASGRDDAW